MGSNIIDNEIINTTYNAAVPNLASTLLIVFQVSPIDKCNTKENNAGVSKVPVVRYTRKLEYVRSIDIVLQMMGNAMGGGIQDGRSLFLNTGSFLLAEGRELSKGENTLDLILRRNIIATTM